MIRIYGPGKRCLRFAGEHLRPLRPQGQHLASQFLGPFKAVTCSPPALNLVTGRNLRGLEDIFERGVEIVHDFIPIVYIHHGQVESCLTAHWTEVHDLARMIANVFRHQVFE